MDNSRLLTAEAAAEREYLDDHDYEDKGEYVHEETDQPPRKTQIKKRHKKLVKIKQTLKVKRKNERKQKQVTQLMQQYLDGCDVVKEVTYGSRLNYIHKCPECRSFVKDKLNIHLNIMHKYSESDSLRKTK